MAFTEVTITGSFQRENGEPAQGTITAQLSKALSNGEEIVNPTPILGQLNKEGQLKAQSGEPFKLTATSDTGTEPANVHYQFTINLDNAPVRSFFASLAPSSPVDITELE